MVLPGEIEARMESSRHDGGTLATTTSTSNDNKYYLSPYDGYELKHRMRSQVSDDAIGFLLALTLTRPGKRDSHLEVIIIQTPIYISRLNP